MFENQVIRNLLLPFYQQANKRIEEFCNNYNNIYYVDVLKNKNYVVQKDVHPNFEERCYMKKSITKNINH